MSNICFVPSHLRTTYSLCTLYLYNTLTCSRMSLGVCVLSFVCLAATSNIGTLSFIQYKIYIYMCVCVCVCVCVLVPFHGFVPCMFCFVSKIFTHPFFLMLCVTVISPSWILIQLMHAMKKWGKGGGICYAACVTNLFCVAIIEVLTILAVYV